MLFVGWVLLRQGWPLPVPAPARPVPPRFHGVDCRAPVGTTRCGFCMVQAIELHIRQQQPHKGAPALGGGLRIRILRGCFELVQQGACNPAGLPVVTCAVGPFGRLVSLVSRCREGRLCHGPDGAPVPPAQSQHAQPVTLRRRSAREPHSWCEFHWWRSARY